MSKLPAPIREVNRAVPEDVAAICRKAKAANPDERYASRDDLAGEIRAFLETRVVVVRGRPRIQEIQKWVVRNAFGLFIAAVVVGVISTALYRWRSVIVENAFARQLNELRDDQLEARNGRWTVALDRLDTAEKLGHTNSIDLAIQRIEIGLILGKHDLVRREIAKIKDRDNLGSYRDSAYLRMADYELSDPSTAEIGRQHARLASNHDFRSSNRRWTTFAPGCRETGSKSSVLVT